MIATIETAIESVTAYLRHLQEEGVLVLDVSADRAATLDFRASSAPAVSSESGRTSVADAEPAQPPQLEWEELIQGIASCGRCSLHEKRRRPVPGQGCANPEILFVGEAPGHEEDVQGLAFVGPAGQLLTRMIEAMGLRREDVYIANILKCRPPLNRKPQPDEMDCCLPFLKAQIALLKPKVIVALGGTAVQGLLKLEGGITRLRGRWQSFEGIDVMPTFHPSYLLRNPSAKREAWEDLKAVLERLGKAIPNSKRS